MSACSYIRRKGNVGWSYLHETNTYYSIYKSSLRLTPTHTRGLPRKARLHQPRLHCLLTNLGYLINQSFNVGLWQSEVYIKLLLIVIVKQICISARWSNASECIPLNLETFRRHVYIQNVACPAGGLPRHFASGYFGRQGRCWVNILFTCDIPKPAGRAAPSYGTVYKGVSPRRAKHWFELSG